MDTKNYTQVLIDGTVYTLGGSEDEAYLQKAAAYVNEKTSTLRRLPGFSKQSADYQTVMIQLNMADDYFKALERAEEAERQRSEMEKESYSLKHELVSTQMKLEAVLKDLEERQRQLEELTGRLKEREEEMREQKETPAETLQQKETPAETLQTQVRTETDSAAPAEEPRSQESESELIGKAMEAARKAGHRGRR